MPCQVILITGQQSIGDGESQSLDVTNICAGNVRGMVGQHQQSTPII